MTSTVRTSNGRRIRARARLGAVAALTTSLAVAGLTAGTAGPAAAAPPIIVGSYSAVAAPPLVAAASSSAYAVRIKNLSLLPITSVRVLVPTGFTVTTLTGAQGGNDVWTLSSRACTSATPPCTGPTGTYLQADAPLVRGTPTPVWPLESVVVSFQATAPAKTGTYTWSTAVGTYPGLSWLNLALTGPPPTTAVYANAAASFVVSGLPTGPVTAGAPFSATVTAVDSNGNVATGYRGTVHFGPGGVLTTVLTSGSGDTLPGDYTFTGGDAGTHTFAGIALTTAPSDGFSVTDTSTASVTGSAIVQITPGPASTLDLSAPANATAGSSFVATVTALDAYGNTATGYTGTVHFTSDDTGTQTSLPADYSFTSTDAGSHPFSVTLTKAGSRTLSVGDGTRNDSAAISVDAGGASHLVIDGPVSAVTAGDPFAVTVSVQDTFGNTVPGFAGTVHLTSSDPDATLPADYTFTSGDAGSHSFPGGVTLTTAGAQSVGVTDNGDGFDPASAAVSVSPAAPDHVAAPGPADAVAGQAAPLTFQVDDRFGNVVTTSSAAVSFTCTGVGDSPGSCPDPTAFSGGQVTVSPVLTVAGAQTVTAASTGITSGVASLTVAPGPAAAIVLSGPASPVTAGASFGVTATVYDAYGNLESSDTGRTVTLSAASPVAPFPLTATTSSGIATFAGIHVTTAGGYVLTGAASPLSDGATGLTVLADATTDHLAVTSAPSAAVPAGTPFSIGVSVQDQYGNTDGTSSASVQLAASPAVGGLPATVAASGGSATFGPFTLTVPGSFGFTATSTGLTGANADVTVSAGTATAIVVTGIADEATNPALPHPVLGKPFDTSVRFVDAYGNTAGVGPSVTITLSRASGTGTLGGTLSKAVPTGATTATFTGSTYSVLENSVVLQVSATSGGPLTAGTITTDVAGEAATVQGTPNVPIPTINSLDPVSGQPCVLSATQTTCSQFSLPKGALGPVYLYQTACPTGCRTGGGSTAQIVYGTGTLTDATGTPLYTRAKPAAMVFQCYVTLCPHPDKDPPGTVYNMHELQEDVAANKLEFTVFLPGSKTQTFTAIATICAKTGIVDASKYFCIDPAKSTRDKKGNYLVTVLFIGDPHGRIT
jgi:hypothetical protein